MTTKNLIGLCTIALWFVLGTSTALSQAATERLRLIQDETRVKLESDRYLKLASPGEKQIDVGGWISFTALDYRDDEHQKGTPDLLQSLFMQDYRLYVNALIDTKLSVYGRVRNMEIAWSTAPGAIAPDTRQMEGVELDLLFAEFKPDSKVLLRLGRQFVRAGRGLTLSNDLDGLTFQYTEPRWSHRAMIGETLNRDPNVDMSIVGFDRSTQDRRFYLAETQYRTESGAKYYGYALFQRDRSRSFNFAQNQRDFHYDSRYFALGTEGRFDKRLHYYAELIHESGSTLADLLGDPRVDIDADGALAGLLFYPDLEWHPLATLEYAYGSGDANRGSVTNTFGGKQTRTDDENFLYFGTYDGGLALSPRLSDLQVIRLGYQIRPLPRKDRKLPDLLVGAKGSRYLKASIDGIISDPTATMRSRDVGWGLDLFLATRPLSDLSLLVQYGRFAPGEAYPAGARDAADRLLATLNLSF